MSGEFEPRKDLRLAKLELRPQIFVKPNFRELPVVQKYLVYILLIIWPKFMELKIGYKQKSRL